MTTKINELQLQTNFQSNSSFQQLPTIPHVMMQEIPQSTKDRIENEFMDVFYSDHSDESDDDHDLLEKQRNPNPNSKVERSQDHRVFER